MAIARQGSAVVGSNIAHASTPSYTVNTSSNLIVVTVATSGSANSVTGITYGGTSLTIQTYENTTDLTWVTLGYLLSPPTGANNIAVTGPSSGSMNVYAADYSGVGTADGSFVTNNATSGASLTTNVSLANANEWVTCGAICGHLTNAFSSTANLTVAQQSQTFLSSALYDSNAGYGSGTVGFVTTLTGSSPRQWVVMQAFTAAASGTAVTADAAASLEALAGLGSDAAMALEALAGLGSDTAAATEIAATLRADATATTETLVSVIVPRGYRGLGGVYGPAIAYWGLRALNASTAAAQRRAIQLQRASDNATMDIHVLPSGALDVASAAAFLAGTTGGVSVWYDQSGNGYDMTQATQSLQPQFQFNATPDGRPGVVFSTTNTTVLRYDAGIPDTVAPLVCAAFAYENFVSVGDHVYVDSVSGGNQGFQNEGGIPSWSTFFYSLNYVTAANAAWHSVQLSLQVGTNTSNLYLDGTSNPVSYTFTGSNPLISGPDALGADTGGLGTFTKYFNGTLTEVGWFATAASAAQLAAGYADQEAAWVTGAAPSGVIKVEVLAGQRADAPVAAEWLASGIAVAGDSLVPLEFAARPVGDGGVRLESSAGQRGEGSATAEFAATRSRDTNAPAAWLRRQAVDHGAAAESLGRQSRDGPVRAENLGAVAVIEDALLPLETLRRQQAEAHAVVEALETSRRDIPIPLENLGGQHRDNGLVAAWLGRTLRDAGATFEFTGGVAVAVLGDSALPLAWGGVVRAEVWAAAELAGGIVAEARFPAELITAAHAGDAALPLAALLRVCADPPLPAEWLGRAATIADAVVPVEIGGRSAAIAAVPDGVLIAVLAGGGPLPIATDQDVARNAGSAIETSARLLRDAPVFAESAARIVGRAMPFAGGWQTSLASLFAALPVEWKALPMLLVSLSRLLASIGKRRILKE